LGSELLVSAQASSINKYDHQRDMDVMVYPWSSNGISLTEASWPHAQLWNFAWPAHLQQNKDMLPLLIRGCLQQTINNTE